MDVSNLFELEIAQWAKVDLWLAPPLVDDTASGENVDDAEFMLRPSGIAAVS